MLLARRITRSLLLAVIVFLGLGGSVRAEPDLTIFAAASMQDVMEEIIVLYENKCDCDAVLSTAGSSVLARQIEAGAPADLFVSADVQWMEYLVERGKISAASIVQIAGNELIVAVPDAENVVEDARQLLERGRFAMADPESVPAGRYARAALESLGIWNRVRSNAVFTENVRVAMRMAARGDVGAAIVYDSDARIEPALSAAYVFGEDTHPPIVYSAGQVEDRSGEAAPFLQFLHSSKAQAVMQKFGFPLPPNLEK
ncbi:MAG: molybdate ABC transporter substrate-binding protein [Rhizobiaceae bacterium]